MLVVPVEVLSVMVDHARTRLPEEACGLIAGPPGNGIVDRFYDVRNRAASDRSFLLDPREMLDVEREVDELGLEIKGVMHSHPATQAYPSPTDVSDASSYDPFGTLRSVIVSLVSESPSVRCFRISSGEVSEEPIIRG